MYGTGATVTSSTRKGTGSALWKRSMRTPPRQGRARRGSREGVPGHRHRRHPARQAGRSDLQALRRALSAWRRRRTPTGAPLSAPARHRRRCSAIGDLLVAAACGLRLGPHRRGDGRACSISSSSPHRARRGRPGVHGRTTFPVLESSPPSVAPAATSYTSPLRLGADPPRRRSPSGDAGNSPPRSSYNACGRGRVAQPGGGRKT